MRDHGRNHHRGPTDRRSDIARNRRRHDRRQRWLDRQFARLAVLPTTVMMLLIFGIPLLFSLYFSFKGWAPDQALFAGSFAGLANYQDLLTDPRFIKSLSVTFIYTAATVATELPAGWGSLCC